MWRTGLKKNNFVMNFKYKAFIPLLRAGVGFTLIELLLVAVLLGVAAGLSIPNLSKIYSKVQLKTTTRQISYLMRYAQSLAVIHQKKYQIHFSADRRTYWLEQEADASENGNEEAFKKIVGDKGRIFTMPQGIFLEAPADVIGFYPDASMDPAEIVVKNKEQKENVISTKERRGQIDVLSLSE
jgi:prepilin-type N-terminal cleavage/methylation domain-containing protein